MFIAAFFPRKWEIWSSAECWRFRGVKVVPASEELIPAWLFTLLRLVSQLRDTAALRSFASANNGWREVGFGGQAELLQGFVVTGFDGGGD